MPKREDRRERGVVAVGHRLLNRRFRRKREVYPSARGFEALIDERAIMTTTASDTIWLTRAAYERLEAELSELSRSTAPSLEVEGRIRDLLAIISRSEVGDKPDDGLVEAGMTVTVQFEGDQDPTTFLLAHRGVTDEEVRSEIDVYSPQSPLGAAITNKFAGDSFHYETPAGAVVRGTIVSATPFKDPSA